jgi:hypothetical protein
MRRHLVLCYAFWILFQVMDEKDLRSVLDQSKFGWVVSQIYRFFCPVPDLIECSALCDADWKVWDDTSSLSLSLATFFFLHLVLPCPPTGLSTGH